MDINYIREALNYDSLTGKLIDHCIISKMLMQ